MPPLNTDLALVQATTSRCLHSLFDIAAHAEHQLDVHIRLHRAYEEESCRNAKLKESAESLMATGKGHDTKLLPGERPGKACRNTNVQQ